MERVELIFIPTPGLGHLISAVEFAKRLIDQDDRIRATVLYMKWSSSAYVDLTKQLGVSQPHDGVQLLDLPQPHDLPTPDLRLKSTEGYVYACVKSYMPQVRTVVRDILSQKSSSDSTRVVGLVLDFFCAPMIDVASELGLPSYIFSVSNTCFLALLLYLLSRHRENSLEFEMTDADEHIIPGFVNPVPQSVLPPAVFNKDGGYTSFIKVAEKLKEAKGIMVNTFQEVEAYALDYFNSDDQTPPIYPVGPVINLDGLPHPELDLAQRDKAMKWLDEQPDSSVIFLCFGSYGNTFGAAQVKEIAQGLEQSGCRFLWSLRPPPLLPQNSKHTILPEELLPEGFLERTQGRGMILAWAPQVEVLGHKAIGGFVSHCGWNSILESLWFGVPIVTWPIYAEQQLNAFQMVKELGLAVELRLDYRRGTSDVVMADEIEKAVGLVMDCDSEVRKKVKEMGETARKAVLKGGSSFISIGKFIDDITANN